MTTGISELMRQEHIQEALKLDAQGYRALYFLRLRPRGEADVLLYFTPTKEVTWQGKKFESFPCHVTGYRRAADEEMSRPKFSVINPDGVFTMYAHEGWLDNAEVVRYMVLKSHLETNINSFVKNTWRISKVVSANNDLVVAELRGATDGQNFTLPAGQYLPPKFPQVSF